MAFKKHITEIASKYIRPSEGTLDFALMYIPAENVYYEIITKGESLDEATTVIDYAFSKHVFPVSPNTFYAYLMTILVGLRGIQVEKNVGLILKEIAMLKKKFGAFVEDFEKIGVHLGNSSSAYDRASHHLSKFEGRLENLETPEEIAASDEKPALTASEERIIS